MMFGERTNQEVSINIGSCAVDNSKEEQLLGILINLCQTAGNKLFALSRMSAYLGTDKLRLLMRAFVTSQFQYCPLVWMFHSRKMNNKINRLHERALRIAYKDFCSSFATLLEKDRSVTIHEKNLQLLMTEMFKTINNLNPIFMKEIFPQRSAAYNLIHSQFLSYILLNMVPKQSHIEGSVFGTLFHMKSKMQILFNNSRIK